jgi:cbb3-type cytochrome oxidase subunit 3
MSATELSIIIQSLLTLIVLAIVVFALWPGQRIDLFRQQVFALRDELFDFAADGKISFDNPAYVDLRELMNGFIRYAHNLTPFRILMSFLRWKCTSGELERTWTESWNKALDQVADQDVRDRLQQFHSRATDLVLGQLILSPGVLIIGVPILVVITLFYTQWTNVRSIYRDVTNRIPISFVEGEAAKA